MTIGIGGSTAAVELEKIKDMTLDVKPIQPEEYSERLKKATAFIKESKFKALYINAVSYTHLRAHETRIGISDCVV